MYFYFCIFCVCLFIWSYLSETANVFESSINPPTISIVDYLHIMIMAAMRSSMSMIGFCMALSSCNLSMFMFCTTFFVSATIAIALYTALSCATWYSGRDWKTRKLCWDHKKSHRKIQDKKVLTIFNKDFFSQANWPKLLIW